MFIQLWGWGFSHFLTEELRGGVIQLKERVDPPNMELNDSKLQQQKSLVGGGRDFIIVSQKLTYLDNL